MKSSGCSSIHVEASCDSPPANLPELIELSRDVSALSRTLRLMGVDANTRLSLIPEKGDGQKFDKIQENMPPLEEIKRQLTDASKELRGAMDLFNEFGFRLFGAD